MGEKKSEKEGKTTIEQVVRINAAAKHTVFGKLRMLRFHSRNIFYRPGS